MIKKKGYDGVVVAARFTKEGKIDWVRAFLRHGFVFSDLLVMDRETLINHLQEGKRFKTGERMIYQGNDFNIIEDIHLVDRDSGHVIVAGNQTSNQDSLGQIPQI